MRSWLVLGLALCGSACAHRVSIQSVPSGALTTFDGDPIGSTPVEITVWSNPFAHPEIELSMPGYRNVSLGLGKDRKPLKRAWELVSFRWKKALGLTPSSYHEVLLVKVHGPSGTWRAEDLPE